MEAGLEMLTGNACGVWSEQGYVPGHSGIQGNDDF